MLLPKKESEAFDDDHEAEDEQLVNENGQGVTTVHQAVALRKKNAKLHDRIKSEIKYIYVKQHCKSHLIPHFHSCK